MNYQVLAQKIIALMNEDLALRDRLIQEGLLFDGYNRDMEALHIKNANLLDEIIDEIGFPSIDKVGTKAYKAACLIIQHAISLPVFMKKCLSLLEKEVEHKNAKVLDLAYLSDRIAMYEGSLQLYGTQFDWDENGKLSALPFDDLVKVNQRRVSIGLNTLEEQTDIIRQRAKLEKESVPEDLEKRRKEVEAWKKKVGWGKRH